MRIEKKTLKSEIRNSKLKMGRPMLFTQNPAQGGTTGNNPSPPEMQTLGHPRRSREFTLTKLP
jgi:hypothetical protein